MDDRVSQRAGFERRRSGYVAQRAEAIIILDLAREVLKQYGDIGF
jgi:hypothetical protein